MSIPTRPKKVDMDVEQRLVEFCSEQINYMKKYTKLTNDEGMVGFFELNSALCEYQNINLALMSFYNLAKLDHVKSKEIFEDWYAEKFLEQREIANPKTVSTQKWLSQKEIEMLVRKTYREEYKSLYMDMILAEQKVAFLRRLLESWASHQFVLSSLSKNVIAESAGTKFESE